MTEQTWSQPINITSQVKVNPDWRFVLAGPGNGITLRDGTLVFPAQFLGDSPAPVTGAIVDNDDLNRKRSVSDRQNPFHTGSQSAFFIEAGDNY